MQKTRIAFSQVLGLNYANEISEYSIHLEETTMEQTRQAHSNKERVKSREADEAEETEPTGQNQLDRANFIPYIIPDQQSNFYAQDSQYTHW